MGDHLRYAFDRLMAKGAWALLAWHLSITLVTILVVSLIGVALGVVPLDEQGERLGFGALLWTTLMHAIDPGTITGNDGSAGWRALMMMATMLGILLVGSLVAILVASVAHRFDKLRQGHSRVLEQDHTLVVGWSSQIFTIIKELVRANESRSGGCVVIYADHDKVWMEDELRVKVPKLGRTRVVVRAGDPTDPASLDVVATARARAIVVLAPEHARDDTAVVRALLAVGRTHPERGRIQHVVTEIRDPHNVAVARLTGDRRTEVLEIGELIAKIAVQTCLQAGLSVVYEELLSFNGNEIYFIDAAPVLGLCFGGALHQFENCVLIGLRDAEGRVVLSPAMDRVIAAGEALVLIAADDDQIHVTNELWEGAATTVDAAEATTVRSSAAPTRTLILGWSTRVPSIVAGINAYAAPGSELLVVSTNPDAETVLATLAPSLNQVTLTHRSDNMSDRRVIDDLDPRTWKHVMVLPDDRIEQATEADAKVLVALLHLRDVAEGLTRPFSVVSEMRDVRSRALAEVARADDFIVSDHFIGLLLTQIAENADLAAVFAELFDPSGAQIYLRPATDYVVAGHELDVHTLVEIGQRRGEVVIGVRLAGHAKNEHQNFGVVINPRKSTRLRLSQADRVIVLAA
ncbi:putative secreted protein [Enhygromyxa salina]|uniref:Putative secreted protein n=1 Tax=Enhygromyxa salina TaxID=215803 RepID=A0A0C2D560_9BACT|nr:putative secreted protein [Enhygromyxa salina]